MHKQPVRARTALFADQWAINSAFHRKLLLVLLVGNIQVQAAEDTKDLASLSIEELMEVRVDQNPVTVLTSHIHKKGEWMIGYRYMSMEMDGNRDGTSDVSITSVLADFAASPTSMRMQSQMMSLMYAPSDDMTLMAMLPYKILSMDHVTRTGVNFTTDAEGLGDFVAMANYVLFRTPIDRHLITGWGGITFPTGSIGEKDDIPTGPDQKLPYPMQLGSGSYDLKLGPNYQYFKDKWSVGARGMGTIRLGENDNGYSLGDVLELDTWLSYGWNNWISTSVRLNGASWGNISGADPDLVPTMVPTADPDRRGGTRLDLQFDIELYAPSGTLKGNRLGMQFGVPVYQDLDGPQLKTDWMITVAWQRIF